jgi:hypothetical protein
MTTAAIKRERLSCIVTGVSSPGFKLRPLAGQHDSARKDAKELRRKARLLCVFTPLRAKSAPAILTEWNEEHSIKWPKIAPILTAKLR